MENCRDFWKSSSNAEDYRDGEDLPEQWQLALSKPESCENFLIGAPGMEDSEDWLNVTPESLDAMLEAKFGVPQKQREKDVPEEFAKFLGKMSDMDGVEEEEEMLGDEDPVMADYLGRLDSEVEGHASDRGDGEIDRVMENLMKSYNAQGGLGGHGPVSSLFKTLGVNPGP